jgi:hypothetical protein
MFQDYLRKRCSDIPCSSERGFARIIDHDQRVLKLHCPGHDALSAVSSGYVCHFGRRRGMVSKSQSTVSPGFTCPPGTDRLRHGRIRIRQLRVGQRKPMLLEQR